MMDTPTLMLDIDKLDENIREIIQFSMEHDVAYRPHIKTHKCVNIAKRQMDFGAVGITVATVGEAEVMAEAGIPSILIAYPVVAEPKLERILALLDKTSIIVTVDSAEQGMILDAFFTKQNRELTVWIKVNTGLNRCGVEPKEEVLQLAQHIQKLPALTLTGIFTHAGHSYGATTKEALDEIAQYEAEAIVASAEVCEAAGIEIPHRSIGSTPTFKIAGAVKGITEIRPGNAVFYDMIQVGLGVATIEQCALTVIASVGSIKKGRIVIDAGSKTLNLDRGAHGNENVLGHGYIKEYPDLIIERLSEEHGIIHVEKSEPLTLGEQLTIIPNHACTAANLFNTYTIHQDGQVIDHWRVDARGRVD